MGKRWSARAEHDQEKGYKEAKEHTFDHLEIVPQNCYVVEDDMGNIIAAMILHPRKDVFEIEDFHVKDIQKNREALALLKKKLWNTLRVSKQRFCAVHMPLGD